MKITVFGSTGKAGIEVLQEALSRGYEVTAYARNPAKITLQHNRLSVAAGELTDKESIRKALAGSDAAISLLGANGKVKDHAISDGVKNIISAMEELKIPRFIQISTSAAKEPLDKRDLYFDFMGGMVKLALPSVYSEIQKINKDLRASSLDWTLVRVPFLNEEAPTHALRIGYKGEKKVRKNLSRADLAWFMVNQVEGSDFIRKAPFISN